MYDICAIGDILIDYVPAADYRPDAPVYQMKTGGTMVNLAAASAKLGMNTLFVGKVGRDFMGRFILDELAGLGVDVRHCPEDSVHPTTQAFVSLSADGERSFSFARRFGADIFLDKEDLPMGQTLSSAMLCFSGMCLTDEPIKSSVRYAVSKAAERGVPIAFDLNYRPGLWRDEASVKKAVAPLLPLIDIYKSSDDELYLVTGEKDFKGCQKTGRIRMPTDRQYEGQSWRRILLSWAYRPRAGVQRACSGHDRRGRLFFRGASLSGKPLGRIGVAGSGPSGSNDRVCQCRRISGNHEERWRGQRTGLGGDRALSDRL